MIHPNCGVVCSPSTLEPKQGPQTQRQLARSSPQDKGFRSPPLSLTCRGNADPTPWFVLEIPGRILERWEPTRKWSGWWCDNHLETYESQSRLLFPIYGTIKNVPNHQPHEISCHFPGIKFTLKESVFGVSMSDFRQIAKRTITNKREDFPYKSVPNTGVNTRDSIQMW